MAGVFLGPDFVTVTKTPDTEWTVLNPDIFACLMDFFTTGTPVVNEVQAGSSSFIAVMHFSSIW